MCVIYYLICLEVGKSSTDPILGNTLERVTASACWLVFRQYHAGPIRTGCVIAVALHICDADAFLS